METKSKMNFFGRFSEGSDDFFIARSMDVFITKLRKKLQDDPTVQILNVRGYGFKLVC
jgi:DNA-binding response OmpR family regulator